MPCPSLVEHLYAWRSGYRQRASSVEDVTEWRI
jgi:hypothetical protein